jgi:hypothetical protein
MREPPTMSDPLGSHSARRLFFIEADDEIDTLLRLLGPLAVRRIRVLEFRIDALEAGVLAVRLETETLDEGRARQLADKLATLPVVRRVGLGWRS